MTSDARHLRIELPEAGIGIALLDWGGDGPPVLLHHANGFCAAVWEPVARGLREHFHVFGLDARGHGDSTSPTARDAYHWKLFGEDVVAVVAQLEERFGPLALGIGHSFGGTALVLAALERPSLFGRLVLLDPVVFPSDPEIRAQISRGNFLAEAARKRREVWDSRDEARLKWAGKETFASWHPLAFERYLAEGFADRPDGRVELKCRAEVEATIFEHNTSVDVMDQATELRTPARVVWARHGNFPRHHFEELVSRFPDAELREAATGHFVPMEDPEFVVAEVLSLQDSTE